MSDDTKVISAVVAGTGFEGRAGRIRFFCKENAPIKLRRDLKNSFDSNAIAVDMQCTILWGLYKPWVQIGYIKKERAKFLAPKLDSGTYTIVDAWVQSYFAPDDIDHPRVSIRIEVIEQVKQKNSNT